MSIWTSIFRYFRRRLLFGLIFALLFIYCVLSLFRNEKKGLTFGNDFDDMDNMIIGENSDDIFNDEDGDEEIVKSPGKPLLWQMEVMNDVGNANSVEFANIDSYGENETSSKPCRNSVQGKLLIVDEKGYVCSRHEVLSNGCCSLEASDQRTISSSVPSSKKTRYSCKTCSPQGCCTIYEYCVSCCLDPNKVKKRKSFTIDQIRKENLKLRRGEDILKLRLRSLDRFQLCLAACRTSSASVQHENTYKNPLYKHCYILQLPSNHLTQRHKRNSISLNNNDNDLRIAFTSSSAVELLYLHLLLHEYSKSNESTVCVYPNLFQIKANVRCSI
ncbi:UPF0454 protein C12orf49 homolog [Nasonia vitripennis]|uniref:SREBP regulating gene protein n=1 Tax=Nasonia vitripennis TaxID=7425 RepID=A0A7M7G420_NASVI|nr:UPF0454 protein C12orf49 homolog [Nasonia vitripennis]